jgi:hypothetical protein
MFIIDNHVSMYRDLASTSFMSLPPSDTSTPILFNDLLFPKIDSSLPMVCRNICRQMQAGHGSYLIGLKYCSTCEVYLYHAGTFCRCCGRQLRTTPNNKKGKERLRQRKKNDR